MDYNRVVKDLNGKSESEFLAAIEKDFELAKAAGRHKPTRKGEFAMYLKGTWYILGAKPALLNITDPVERLDVSILQKHLLSPVLGIDDPRTSKRIDFVGGIRGIGRAGKTGELG